MVNGKRSNYRKAKRTAKTYFKKAKSINNPEMRFKQINPYKVKPEPFPRVLYTRVKFGEVGVISTNNLTTAVSRTYRLNSIWSPIHTTGPTVTGHAELASIYNRYLVTGCKVNIRFFDPSGESVRVGVRLRIDANGATAGNTQTQLVNQPMTYIGGLANSGKQTKNFNMFIRPWTLMGLSKLEYMANSTNYSSNISANPTVDRCLMDIFCVSGDGAVHALSYTVRLTYYVQLYDRIYLDTTI